MKCLEGGGLDFFLFQLFTFLVCVFQELNSYICSHVTYNWPLIGYTLLLLPVPVPVLPSVIINHNLPSRTSTLLICYSFLFT